MIALYRSIKIISSAINIQSKCRLLSSFSIKLDVALAPLVRLSFASCRLKHSLFPIIPTPVDVAPGQTVPIRQFNSAVPKFSRLNSAMADTNIGRLSPNDPSSFSNPEDVRAERIRLQWNIDFERKVIGGSAVYELVVNNGNVSHMILDIKDISIKSVTDASTGTNLEYSVGDKVSTFGQPLKITLPSQKQKAEIKVEYETAPNQCSALQWLDKEQTAGKECPYLFSQCEAIHARSLIPCQDTPSTKASYHAEVVAPKDIQVLMSAVRSGQPEVLNSTQKRYTFEQKVPIPSYLIAIVAGKITSKRIGPRSEVWAEPQLLEAAAFEFEDTEKMLQAAESVCGDYVWGAYDILVLPPSFPFGGMENPCLTFATPTLLAGDKSLANVIAHEIAHSWTGNLGEFISIKTKIGLSLIVMKMTKSVHWADK